MPHVRLIPGNTAKLALTSVGLGFFLSGIMQFVFIGFTSYTGTLAIVGAGMIGFSFTIPGRRYSRVVEVKCTCPKPEPGDRFLHTDPYCEIHGGL
jgi:hypothetical protein